MINTEYKKNIAYIAWDLNSSHEMIDMEFINKLSEHITKAVDNDSIKGVILSSVTEVFLRGFSPSKLAHIESSEQALTLIKSCQKLTSQIEQSSKPVIAIVNGVAENFGLELALACHCRVALPDAKSSYGFSHLQMGIVPIAGGVQRLVRMIGIAETITWLMQHKYYRQSTLIEFGLIQLVEDKELLESHCLEWVDLHQNHKPSWFDKKYRIPGGAASHPKIQQLFATCNVLLRKKSWGNAPSLQWLLAVIYEGAQLPIEKALSIELHYSAKAISSVETNNILKTLYVHKQQADALYQKPTGYQPNTVKTLGILGAGMMGAGIAQVSALHGIKVLLIDKDLESSKKAHHTAIKRYESLLNNNKITPTQFEKLQKNLSITDNYCDLSECDLVIEAVIEDREIKAIVTKKTEEQLAENAFIASNTSTLPITELSDCLQNPEKFIGLHFFSPVDKMPLLEIITGSKTSQETLAKALDFCQQIGKTPIVVKDSRGFYTSRVFQMYIKEGMAMVAEGIAPALIENAARMAGMPVGPLALTDEVSIELVYHIMQQTRNDLGLDYKETLSDQLVNDFMLRHKRLGKKSTAGFYDYHSDGSKTLWTGLSCYYRDTINIEFSDIQYRLMIVQCIEAQRCLQENVVTNSEDADLGSILGWGFPAFTGGVCSYVDYVGEAEFLAKCQQFTEQYGSRFHLK